jgi:hypothetical protein
MSEIDDVFNSLVGGLRDEGLGAEVAQRPDAPFFRDGERVEVRIHPEVSAVISRLVREYAELLDDRTERLAMLFPDAYEDSDEENAAWALLNADSMRAERQGRCETVLRGLNDSWFPLVDADDWLRVFNDLRLVVVGREVSDEGLESLYKGDTPDGVVFILASAVLQALLAVA